jgi:hydrogenase large subunit
MRQIVIDPVTRLEGHLKVIVSVDAGKVVDAQVAGTLYRGFEPILAGRDPRDAIFLTQRICGVCPADHATAAALALDDACGVQIPHNGRLLRNLMLGGNYLQSHITHFYHLSLPDYVKMPDVAPFNQQGEGDFRFSKQENERMTKHYFRALEIRRKCHEFVAHFGGKMPHLVSIIVGGTSQNATPERIEACKKLLREISDFVNNEYQEDTQLLARIYGDYFKLGQGCGNLLAFGAFPMDDANQQMLFKRGIYREGSVGEVDASMITEDASHAWYSVQAEGGPGHIQSIADPDKAGAYSWVKAPRYNGAVCEVGPLARMWISGHYRNAISAMDRIIARSAEARIIAMRLSQWLDELDVHGACEAYVEIPDEASGIGMTEAARGALGHWVKISQGRIKRSEAVVPTTWNASPRDRRGNLGPMEKALVGLPVTNPDNPMHVIRVIHSFDPCLACAVHLIRPGKPISEYRI